MKINIIDKIKSLFKKKKIAQYNSKYDIKLTELSTSEIYTKSSDQLILFSQTRTSGNSNKHTLKSLKTRNGFEDFDIVVD